MHSVLPVYVATEGFPQTALLEEEPLLKKFIVAVHEAAIAPKG